MRGWEDNLVVRQYEQDKEGPAMKKVALSVCFLVIAVAILPVPARAFNPAAHIYIADHVLPTCVDKTNLFYGSIAPDLSQYADEQKWLDSFVGTHYTYANLAGYASGVTQKAFAAGWFSHNEYNGADHYAHGVWDGTKYVGGYVTDQALALIALIPNLTPDFAHFAIETAIDLLLKEEHDRSLGTKLLMANLLRSPLDLELLTKVLVRQHRETDWFTLVSAEFTLRSAINQYASALVLPTPFDKEAVIKLGVQLAQQEFGLTVTPRQLGQILDAAIQLCRGRNYYYSAIIPAIDGIKVALPH
jgi:hypothetical protein